MWWGGVGDLAGGREKEVSPNLIQAVSFDVCDLYEFCEHFNHQKTVRELNILKI